MDGNNVVPRRMSLSLLEEITNGFSKHQKVGAGSYANVYKGELKNGETIAVKVLHYIPGLDDEQFEKEYLNIASLQHKNVVRLVGYCHETVREVHPFNGKMVFAEMTKRALCFDYMHNGSLDKYLSDELTGLDWRTRYAVIKGICQGLKYLHEELQSPMYHLDLKPANVLLDENMVPKLADFGLSRLLGGEQTRMTTSAIGTLGFVPPEYIDAGIISNKFDIFSLGVVIIKIMTGPTGYYRSEEMSSQEFIDNICPCISTKSELLDIPPNKLISYPLHVTDNRGNLHETIVSTICKPEDDTTTFKELIQPKIKIIDCMDGLAEVYRIDVHPTEPWILVGHILGAVSAWNHQTQWILTREPRR